MGSTGILGSMRFSTFMLFHFIIALGYFLSGVMFEYGKTHISIAFVMLSLVILILSQTIEKKNE